MTMESETERLRREILLVLEQQERAVTVAHESLRERLAGMNEIREAMREQAATFAVAREVNIRLEAMAVRIEQLESFKSNIQGRMAVTVALCGIFLVLVQIVLRIFLK